MWECRGYCGCCCVVFLENTAYRNTWGSVVIVGDVGWYFWKILQIETGVEVRVELCDSVIDII